MGMAKGKKGRSVSKNEEKKRVEEGKKPGRFQGFLSIKTLEEGGG